MQRTMFALVEDLPYGEVYQQYISSKDMWDYYKGNSYSPRESAWGSIRAIIAGFTGEVLHESSHLHRGLLPALQFLWSRLKPSVQSPLDLYFPWEPSSPSKEEIGWDVPCEDLPAWNCAMLLKCLSYLAVNAACLIWAFCWRICRFFTILICLCLFF